MKNPRISQWASVAVFIFAVMGGSARAINVAIDFDPASIWSGQGGPNTYGWGFSVRSDIQITALGLWDHGTVINGEGGPIGDGLYESHPMAIWDISDPSTPLVSVVFPTDTGTLLLKGFRYMSISPLTLQAGHDYAIAAKYGFEGLDDTTGAVNNPPFVLTVASEIDFAGYRWGGGSAGLVFPDHFEGGHGLFGPNFIYNKRVPDSGVSIALLSFGFGMIAFAKRLQTSRPTS